MRSYRLTFTFSLLLLVWTTSVLLVVADAKNPLNKLFMNKREQQNGGGGGGGGPEVDAAYANADKTPPPQDDGGVACVSPLALEAEKDKLKVVEAAWDQAKLEGQEASNLVKHYQQELERIQHESKTQIDDLTKSFETATQNARAFQENVERLKQMNAQTDAELEQARSLADEKERELQNTWATLEQRIVDVENEWRQKVADVKLSTQTHLLEQQQTSEEQTRQLHQEKETLMGEIHVLRENVDRLQEKYDYLLRDQAETMKNNLAENLDQAAGQKCGEQVDVLQQEMRILQESSTATVERVRAELARANEESNKLREDLQNLDVASRQRVAEVEETSRQSLENFRSESSRALDETLKKQKSLLDEEVAKKEKERKEVEWEKQKVEHKTKQLEEALKQTEEKHKEAVSDAKHWESLYEKRSYLNLTQITTDATVVATKASRQASEQLSKAAVVAAKVSKDTSEQLTRAARTTATYATQAQHEATIKSRQVYEGYVAPAVGKSYEVYEKKVYPEAVRSAKVTRELYDVHMKEHVDKHAFPIYHAYIEPHVETARVVASEAYVQGKVLAKDAFDAQVKMFKSSCPSIKSSLRSLEKDKGYNIPPRFKETTQYSCSHPEESVATFLKVMAILLLILFRRPIWLIIWTPICWICGWIWFFSPIRLLFYHKKKPASGKKEVGDGSQKQAAKQANGKKVQNGSSSKTKGKSSKKK